MVAGLPGETSTFFRTAGRARLSSKEVFGAMRYLRVSYQRSFLFSLFLLAAIGSTSSLVLASGVNLSWQDNSTNENGFKIERKSGGDYAEIASVGPNIQSYADTNLLS